MVKDPWTDPDPQPDDFDAELHRAQIEVNDDNTTMLVSLEGGEAKRLLERIATERGQQPSQVVSELLPSA